jgi:hypothetical protein
MKMPVFQLILNQYFRLGVLRVLSAFDATMFIFSWIFWATLSEGWFEIYIFDGIISISGDSISKCRYRAISHGPPLIWNAEVTHGFGPT